jgi:glycosyltransferase involved in cell wall biosynthesis
VWGTGGGPEKTILHGAALANRDDVAVTVSYIRDQRDEVFALHRRAADLQIDYQEITERHSFDVGVWQQLLHLVRERQIDIVHSHDYKTDLLAWLLMRRTGVIALSTVHGWSGYSRRERLVYYPVGKRLLARFPAVIAVSTKIKNELVRCGVPSDRVEVILNSIDTSVFRGAPELRPPARRQLAVDDDDFVIGAVGRIEREKRFDLLIRMFAQVVAEHPRARLVIVGDGSLRAELTSLSQSLGVLDACRWLGHRDDLVELYQAFDVLVQSSETEGTPNAILEAMATETPIVATDVGGTTELARPGIDGLVVPNHDVAALKAAVDSVRLDPEGARARSISARRRAEGELSFVARTRRLERLYQRLAQEHGRLGKEPSPADRSDRLGQAR